MGKYPREYCKLKYAKNEACILMKLSNHRKHNSQYQFFDTTLRRTENVINLELFLFHRIETGNGIIAEEHGQFKPGSKEDEGVEQVQGSYQYTADDGTPVRIEYVADENGFQPTGEILPKAPEIPAAIARALEYIEANPKPEGETKS